MSPNYDSTYPTTNAPRDTPPPTVPTNNSPAMTSSNSGFAVTSLVCSLVGVVFLPIIGGLLGIILGAVALTQTRNSNQRVQGRGLALAGIIVGAVSVVLWVSVLAFLNSHPDFL
jgi:uncharacterized protein DUF4190